MNFFRVPGAVAWLRCRRLVIALMLAGAFPAVAAEPPESAIGAAARAGLPALAHSGFTIALAHHGRIVYEHGFGFRDDGTPDQFIPGDHNYYGMPIARRPAPRATADARTIYPIGSVTKQFTAAAILKLGEQGKLGLDDPLARYAPEFADRRLTLRMLLNQRSGLRDYNDVTFLQRVLPLARRANGSLDTQRITREIAAVPRDFAPGERFAYSNSNYFVLGTVVERVSGRPFATYLRTQLCAPLQMTRTALGAPASGDDVALGYRTGAHGAVFRANPWNLAWLGGSGGMTATAGDLVRWDIALLGGRVIGPQSLVQMLHGLDAGPGQGAYAMGWVEDALGRHRYLWHNGELGGFHSLNVVFPGDELAFSILANNQDDEPEVVIPRIAALYFPVTGLDRILPRSGIALVEASFAIAVGAFAVAIVAVVALKRFVVVGVVAAFVALVIGFFAPSVGGYLWGGVAAMVPIAGYLIAVRWVRRQPVTRDVTPSSSR